MRFELNPASYEELARSPEMRGFVSDLAQSVLERARGLAPVGMPRGAYKRSLVATPATETSDGVTASVGSTSSFWHLVEFGSVNNRPYRVLETAARQSGLRFEEGR